MSKLGDAGACEATITALTAQRDHAVAVELCYKSVFSLCGNESNRLKFGSTSACEMVASTMAQHNEIPSLAGYGCKAVAALSGSDSNRVRLASAGACEQVVLAMRVHMDDPIVAENSCWAACRLSLKNDENKAALHKHGISEVLIKLVSKHQGIAAVAEKGREAMRVFLG